MAGDGHPAGLRRVVRVGESVPGPIEVVPYDPAWPVRFEAEKQVLRVALSAWLAGERQRIGDPA